MLRKDAMTPGARVRVLPVIKDGLPANMGGSDPKPYLLMAPSAGVRFGEGWEVHSGEVLTIVEGPKRRNGINTIIARTDSGQEGHVFWCEARVSCESIVAKAVRHDRNAYRIMLDDVHVATALALSNGRWGMYGVMDENKMTDTTWARPADVAAAYEAHAPSRSG